jgi:phosphoadenosine phosphosulfate reductase
MEDSSKTEPDVASSSFQHPGPSKGVPEGIADRLRLIPGQVPGRIVFTTSFGLEDQLLAHHIFAGRLNIDVVTLDTGRLFPSTYRLWQETEERYGVRIRSFHPEAAPWRRWWRTRASTASIIRREARIACCEVRKVEPLGRALAGAAAWVTGLRADQSGQRSAVDC